MRKHHQQTKSYRKNTTAAKPVVPENIWDKTTGISFGDYRLPNTIDSSDTDDNAPPKEPQYIKHTCHDKKITKKVSPTLLPGNKINLNRVPAMPSHLRRTSPSRPRILKTSRCTESSPKGYTERLPDSSSEDEDLSLRIVRRTLFHKPQMLIRPKSAPTGQNTSSSTSNKQSLSGSTATTAGGTYTAHFPTPMIAEASKKISPFREEDERGLTDQPIASSVFQM